MEQAVRCPCAGMRRYTQTIAIELIFRNAWRELSERCLDMSRMHGEFVDG